jgi:hypothetical protein
MQPDYQFHEISIAEMESIDGGNPFLKFAGELVKHYVLGEVIHAIGDFYDGFNSCSCSA